MIKIASILSLQPGCKGFSFPGLILDRVVTMFMKTIGIFRKSFRAMFRKTIGTILIEVENWDNT